MADQGRAGDGAMRHIAAVRMSYSHKPWRLIDSQTGCEITFPEEFDHPNLGPMILQNAAFATKQDALDALGRMAAQVLTARERADA